MKQIYFNIWNGEVGQPSEHLPAFRVTTHRMKIIKIEACFSIGNIIRYGKEWYEQKVHEEWKSWEIEHPHLMTSLKQFIKKEYLKHPFRATNFDDTNYRYPFIDVWKTEKRK